MSSKSALYCGHANEAPSGFILPNGVLMCNCPSDCYCKEQGNCGSLPQSEAEQIKQANNKSRFERIGEE